MIKCLTKVSEFGIHRHYASDQQGSKFLASKINPLNVQSW